MNAEKLLEEFIDAYEEEEHRENERWKITDLAGADWVFRKLQKIDEDLESKTEYAEKEILKYNAYIESLTKQAERDKERFYFCLEQYLNEEKEKDPKFRIKTAQGSANYRKNKSWKYNDEKVLGFLKENELTEFIRVKEEINKTDLKKSLKVTKNNEIVTEDGEVVEGIQIVETQKLSVKLTK